MSWWYRSAVDAVARVPAASLLYPPLTVIEAYCLLRAGGHTLFCDEEVGHGNAYWLPDFTPSGARCFEWHAEHQFGSGQMTLTVWLAAKRRHLMARYLLLTRPPSERQIKRPKVFKPTERQKAAAAKRRQGVLL